MRKAQLSIYVQLLLTVSCNSLCPLPQRKDSFPSGLETRFDSESRMYLLNESPHQAQHHINISLFTRDIHQYTRIVLQQKTSLHCYSYVARLTSVIPLRTRRCLRKPQRSGHRHPLQLRTVRALIGLLLPPASLEQSTVSPTPCDLLPLAMIQHPV